MYKSIQESPFKNLNLDRLTGLEQRCLIQSLIGFESDFRKMTYNVKKLRNDKFDYEDNTVIGKYIKRRIGYKEVSDEELAVLLSQELTSKEDHDASRRSEADFRWIIHKEIKEVWESEDGTDKYYRRIPVDIPIMFSLKERIYQVPERVYNPVMNYMKNTFPQDKYAIIDDEEFFIMNRNFEPYILILNDRLNNKCFIYDNDDLLNRRSSEMYIEAEGVGKGNKAKRIFELNYDRCTDYNNLNRFVLYEVVNKCMGNFYKSHVYLNDQQTAIKVCPSSKKSNIVMDKPLLYLLISREVI